MQAVSIQKADQSRQKSRVVQPTQNHDPEAIDVGQNHI
jgi:hypothetical protein